VTTLHITNGDHAAGKLRRVIDGTVITTCDVLHEGPAPRVDERAWYDLRARYLADHGPDAASIRESLAASDRAIAEACAHGGDLVLWFEHDLYDQLLLVRTLDLIGSTAASAKKTATPAVSLICIDRFPGVERFIGLGQLTADQLATLIPTALPVTADQYALATIAWNAFRAPDPHGLEDLALSGGAAANTLPFLEDALKRFLAEFPSTANGLSRTDTLALQALSRGPLAAHALFRATQDEEPRPFMGDWTFYRALRTLASARVPLVSTTLPVPDDTARTHMVEITAAGRDVLAGRADAIALNGIDQWRGGVRLSGQNQSPWRWDAGRETLVS
jgi:hypothetical protein